MPLTDIDRLRGLLGERIPSDGTATDTLFSDPEIQDFLDQAGGHVRAAAWIGWSYKASEYANLADISEGNSSRNLSDLAASAEKRIADFLPDAIAAGLTTPETGRGRVKIGVIQRSGGSIE